MGSAALLDGRAALTLFDFEWLQHCTEVEKIKKKKWKKEKIEKENFKKLGTFLQCETQLEIMYN